MANRIDGHEQNRARRSLAAATGAARLSHFCRTDRPRKPVKTLNRYSFWSASMLKKDFRDCVSIIMLPVVSLALMPAFGCTKQDQLIADPHSSFISIEGMTMTLTVRDVDTGLERTITLVPPSAEDTAMVFESAETDPDTGVVTILRTVVPVDDFNKLRTVDTGNGTFSLVAADDGTPTGGGGTIDLTRGPAENEVTYTGTLTDGVSTVEFTAIVDPPPPAVVIVIIAAVASIYYALIATAACTIIALTSDCPSETIILALFAACAENGGKPQIIKEYDIGIDTDPEFSIKCSVKCEVRCE